MTVITNLARKWDRFYEETGREPNCILVRQEDLKAYDTAVTASASVELLPATGWTFRGAPLMVAGWVNEPMMAWVGGG